MTCICGCPEERHQHWRAGTDCGYCGFALCPIYQPRRTEPLLTRIRRALRRHR